MTGVDYVRVAEGEPLPDIARFRPFKAVVVGDAASSAEWRGEAGKWLVESGCLYMMAWGRDAEDWHDAVDWANRRRFPDETPDDQLVMTTSHDDEPLKEVFWYAQFCASHPEADLEHALIVHVSAESARDDMLALYEAAGRDDYLPD
jgi:hypothetical protein